MKLSHLLTVLPDHTIVGDPNVEITSVAYDSRQVKPGTLFVAVPSVGGSAVSGGYRFIDMAQGSGAAAIVTQAEVAIDLPCVQVPDARAALADLAAAFFSYPSRELRLYAVTGTDGKTTTTYLLEQILRSAGYRTGLIGTVEIKVGDRRIYNADRMTTPESLDLQRLLRTMVDEGVTHVAIEASSHALALDRLRGCEFAGRAVTNITGDHVEFHGSWGAYFDAKARLFHELGAGSIAVLNRDDASYERLSGRCNGPVLSYGLRTGVDLWATNLGTGPNATDCRFVTQTDEAQVHVPMSGVFNVSNALAAAALALQAGMDLPTIARALAAASPPPGRMQRIRTDQQVDIVIDYAHTVNAFRSVLSSLRAQAHDGARVIAVFGAAGNRDRGKRPVLAQIAREFTDFFIVTNEDPFGEPAASIIEEVASGADPAEEGIRFVREPDRGAAIRRALDMARPGDVVAITGKGHEQSIVVHGRKEPWSDLGAVQRVLESGR